MEIRLLAINYIKHISYVYTLVIEMPPFEPVGAYFRATYVFGVTPKVTLKVETCDRPYINRKYFTLQICTPHSSNINIAKHCNKLKKIFPLTSFQTLRSSLCTILPLMLHGHSFHNYIRECRYHRGGLLYSYEP